MEERQRPGGHGGCLHLLSCANAFLVHAAGVSVFVEEGCDPLCIRGRKHVHFVPVSAEWLVALNNKLTYTR